MFGRRALYLSIRVYGIRHRLLDIYQWIAISQVWILDVKLALQQHILRKDALKFSYRSCIARTAQNIALFKDVIDATL